MGFLALFWVFLKCFLFSTTVIAFLQVGCVFWNCFRFCGSVLGFLGVLLAFSKCFMFSGMFGFVKVLSVLRRYFGFLEVFAFSGSVFVFWKCF